MADGGPGVRWLVAAVSILVAACTTAALETRVGQRAASTTGSTPTSTSPSTPAATAPATTTQVVAVAATVAEPSTTTTPKFSRPVTDQEWTPFATAGGVVLRHPSARVERVGFHESNHEGAQQLVALPTAASPVSLEARGRETAPFTAADVVMDPDVEVRAPVTGRVKRAGTYVLYCRHSDDYVVIAPDEQPTWEVKILHIDGVKVRAGQRVKAGVTVLAPRATQLPFESQVDEVRAVDPAWPHVHIEVVDPAIKNRPSPNSGC